jgi:hypothetical protein
VAIFPPRPSNTCRIGQLSSNVRPHIHTTVRRQALRIRSSAPITMSRFGNATNSCSAVKGSAALVRHFRCATPSYSSRSVHACPPVALGPEALTPQGSGQHVSHSSGRTTGKAQSAQPGSRSGAAAAEYASRNTLLRASARSTASSWSSRRQQRGAGSVRRGLGTSPAAGLPQ